MTTEAVHKRWLCGKDTRSLCKWMEHYGFDRIAWRHNRVQFGLDDLLLDGDADDIVNPDNVGVSQRVIVIQEDRYAEHRYPEVAGGYG